MVPSMGNAILRKHERRVCALISRAHKHNPFRSLIQAYLNGRGDVFEGLILPREGACRSHQAHHSHDLFSLGAPGRNAFCAHREAYRLSRYSETRAGSFSSQPCALQGLWHRPNTLKTAEYCERGERTKQISEKRKSPGPLPR